MYRWRAFESVWSELLKKDQSGHPNLRKASNYDIHQIRPSRKPVLSYILKKQWLRLSLRTIEYAINTYKKYFYTFRINQITFTYGERKKERPNFYGMFSQNLPISATFIAILKITLPQCNTNGVRAPHGFKRCKIFGGTNQDIPCKKANLFVRLCISYLRPAEFAASLSGKKFLQCYRFRFPSPTIKLLRLLKNRFLLDFLVHHSEGLTLKHLTNMIFWGMTNSNRVKCAWSNSHRTWLINSIHHLLNKGFSDKWSTLVVTNKISLSLSLLQFVFGILQFWNPTSSNENEILKRKCKVNMCFNWLLASVIKLQMKFVKLSLITYKFPGSLRRKNTYDNVNVSLSKDVNCGRKRWTEFMNRWLQHINFRLPISYLKSDTMALRRHKRIFSKRGTRFTSSLDNFFVMKEISILL